MVGAVEIELKAALKTRKLLIPLNEKNGKNTEFTQVRYAAGTRNDVDEFLYLKLSGRIRTSEMFRLKSSSQIAHCCYAFIGCAK